MRWIVRRPAVVATGSGRVAIATVWQIARLGHRCPFPCRYSVIGSSPPRLLNGPKIQRRPVRERWRAAWCSSSHIRTRIWSLVPPLLCSVRHKYRTATWRACPSSGIHCAPPRVVYSNADTRIDGVATRGGRCYTTVRSTPTTVYADAVNSAFLDK
jgi:hypothetical protein